MVAKAKTSKTARKGEPKGRAGGVECLHQLILSRTPAEDLQSYDDAALVRTAELVTAAVEAHQPGHSVQRVNNSSGVERFGRQVTTVTVVNDNMPFLFDSVLGELSDSAGEPTLVLHPVLYVRHGRKGVEEIAGDAASTKPAADLAKISVIHVHLPRLSDEECKALEGRLAHMLKQVRAAVTDWKPMLARLDQEITELRYAPVPLEQEAVAEAIAFLEWLRDDNFTFLGMREFRYTGGEKSGTLERSHKKGLGILADPDVLVLRRGTEAVSTTPEIRAFLHGPDPLIVTKANAKSVVHRRAYLDYIGVKTFSAEGKLTGELRIVGLFTSTAYTRSVMKIPYLRSKAEAVIAKSGFAPTDHSGKALINVLESYPRDELFQIGVPILRKHAEAILALGERPRVRALYRVDQFDRFVSVLVFVPRDRYDSQARVDIGTYLKTVFKGRVSAYYPAFPEGMLARVHFIIGRSGGKTPRIETETLEAGIRNIVRTWDDALQEAVETTGTDPRFARIAAAFPESYRNGFSAETALIDAERMSVLSDENPIAIDFHRHPDQEPHQAVLKIHHHRTPVPLTQRVPLLENMGFRVISERTFEVGDGDDKETAQVFIHDMELENAFDGPIDLSDDGALFEELFLSVWRREQDDDRLNALAQTARLRAAEIAILRAYSRYLQQASIPQSQDFIAGTLNRYPHIARKLFSLFVLRFDPAAASRPEAEKEEEAVVAAIGTDLDRVPNLDDDTIIRRFLNLIQSTLRTNHYAPGAQGAARSLALKFDSRAITGLPQPRPWREIFVYGQEVEGVHLRFGPVARGGLRWSDRAQDYRTEVLGLVKAQQVKNAVIVPVGAKGGFYPRRLPAGGSRQEVFEAGRAAYINFVSSLLSITDDLDGAKVVPPEGVIRHDANDPYFVVAADKGTATFSDTANEISQVHGFWLDDAFASGGSAGYDHKKMGITARGAWEAVKRHFREMNRDIQNEPFTAVGVGDMSGDVFGNGMLLSHSTRVIAAFDHRDIFIDPDPDPAISYAERKRLFDLPRSSWQDYDASKLSKGGMIVSRSQKSITLSRAAADAIGLAETTASPTEIMTAILRAPVDLLWFGGIGTYVRASSESNQEVGDRANDPIRITAREVGAKVIGEGANLGVTQLARIEFGLKGGRCNSDAIDNSGGVNSSDVEVNIKIALAAAMRGGSLERPARNRLLADMTEEVAKLVLANNYQQTLAISQVERRGMTELPHQARMMVLLEQRGLLDRAVEFLPGPQQLADRESRGEPLTRAEIGVLLAYAKIVLFDEIVASKVPDEPHLEADLLGYFPERMAKKYEAEIRGHRLRREIVATELANDVINRGGPSFVTRLQDVTGRPAADIVAAFTVVREGFDLPAVYAAIDALDNRIDGAAQLELYQIVWRLIYSATSWQLKNETAHAPLGERVERLRRARAALEPRMKAMLPAVIREHLLTRSGQLVAAGAPEKLAERLAFLEVAEMVPDIALVADKAKADLAKAAEVFFGIMEAFRIGRIEEAANAIVPTDYYDGLALFRAMDMISAARRGMAIAALSEHSKANDPAGKWVESGGEHVVRVRERLQSLVEGGEITVSRLTVASGLMSDLSV
ncbi:NAD-glutamate dehydrogenase [Nitratireductor sp. ZSWI3]|uniref:NAD-glutamate dehydrogenase n=1 Tax=Nitratireductor sp. ZSWI3 TaxID=2966359 RepID=UPI0021502E4E|nr:NAD-glutamate dehydrogenase [Nitratireductor sp. ZSWI3]MCR4267421.1 NAD-glutamate dehydrogenase [Nitratireductor sp. ZSWI3]